MKMVSKPCHVRSPIMHSQRQNIKGKNTGSRMETIEKTLIVNLKMAMTQSLNIILGIERLH